MKTKPTEKQLKFLDWEVGMFFHFGIRTFNTGHRDWDGIEMSAETFMPTMLDCRQWIRTAKDFGAKYAIMTTKHHDGFALWPTAYSEYSVKASPWKGGHGDVVREFTDACRAEGVATGLYYSPAQWGSTAVKFDKESEYDDYFINQIGELLTNYGKIDYLWFDGCGSAGHKYDQKRIITAIRTMQPDILVFGMWDPDTLWCGNEDGYARQPNFYTRTIDVMGQEVTRFAPDECDCRLRGHWFYDKDEHSIKSVEELIGMYEMSVGRGANLLLNVGPDDTGLISARDRDRLTELRAEIDRRYASPLSSFGDIKKTGDNTYSIEYTDVERMLIRDTDFIPHVRSIIIKEDVTGGQSIMRYKLYAHIPSRNPISDNKYCVWQGETIGHKAICRFPAVRTLRFTLEILDSDGEHVITDMKAYS